MQLTMAKEDKCKESRKQNEIKNEEGLTRTDKLTESKQDSLADIESFISGATDPRALEKERALLEQDKKRENRNYKSTESEMDSLAGIESFISSDNDPHESENNKKSEWFESKQDSTAKIESLKCGAKDNLSIQTEYENCEDSFANIESFISAVSDPNVIAKQGSKFTQEKDNVENEQREQDSRNILVPSNESAGQTRQPLSEPGAYRADWDGVVPAESTRRNAKDMAYTSTTMNRVKAYEAEQSTRNETLGADTSQREVIPETIESDYVSESELRRASNENVALEEARHTERSHDLPDEQSHVVEARLVEEMLISDRELMREEIRRDIINGTVVGQVVAADEAPRQQLCCRPRILIILACLIVIIAVVLSIVIVGSMTNDLGKDVGGALSPSSSPTFFRSPTQSPSSLPSLSPSTFPTATIEGLDNGKREEAHHIYLKGPKLENNLKQSAAIQEIITINGGAALLLFTYGLWYKYHANRSGPVTIIVCGGFNQVLIYSENYNHLDTYVGGGMSYCEAISIWTESQRNYSILVDGGSDQLQLPDANFTIEIDSNRECKFAYGLVEPTSVGVSFLDSIQSDPPGASAVPVCGGASSSHAGEGIWYRIKGNGQLLIVSTCSELTSFDTQISVFQGLDFCNGGLECINGNNDFCGTSSYVAWPSEDMVDYYVFIHGGVGDVEVNFQTEIRRPENDFCVTASSLFSMGGNDDVGRDEFTLEGSTADAEVPICGVTLLQNKVLHYGIWYKVVASNTTDSLLLKLTTYMGLDSSSPASIQIYSGSCGKLDCVLYTRSVSTIISQWVEEVCIPGVEEGETYYIFVSNVSLDSFANHYVISATTAGSCTKQ